MEHLAEAGGDRTELGPADALGQLHARESLAHQLTRQVDADGVVERGNHLGKAELRDGADVLQARETADGQLDELRDLLLDLQWIQGWRDGVDLHLHRRRVGKRIDRETVQRRDAQPHEHGRQEADQQAIAQ